MTIFPPLKSKLFNYVHTNNLVYNTCWEDPRCDKELLQLNQDSNVVMITSAGCNALSYLLEQPSRIHCIDMNPRQNALLSFKRVLFQEGDYSTLFRYFGEGSYNDYYSDYVQRFRQHLPYYDRRFWDQHIHAFSPSSRGGSFYYSGSAGWVAWICSILLKTHKSVYRRILDLLNASTLTDQKKLFSELEPKLFNSLTKLFVNRHATMCLLGVPESQQELFTSQYENGALGFIQNKLQHVFTNLNATDNYFYRVYLTGKYTTSCAPEYLLAENFSILNEHINKINIHTTTISDFLRGSPDTYSHFVLLDHQDWLAKNDVDALQEEWRLILKNSKSGSRILLRSASNKVEYLPDFVQDRVDFNDISTTESLYNDRVGTYASTLLGVVK